MKIFCCDNASFKFSQVLIDHWRGKGHDVIQEMGMNPQWAEWADLTYIDWMDQNFYCLFNGPNGDQSSHYPKKRVAVRLIDIDIWQGRHRAPVIWDYLDDAIVINKFYYDMIHEETTPYSDGKLHLIPMGVDLNNFTLKDRKERGYKIACVTGNIWEAKDGFGAIRIFQEVCRLYPDKPWELHIRGQMIEPKWHEYAYNQLIEVSGLKDRIHIIPVLNGPEGMRDFYHTMDYTLVTSHKEAFSFAAAEGMACGLKPVINNFFGSDDIWPEKYKFSNFHDAVSMIGEGEYNPEEYRQFIRDHFNIEQMFKAYDELFGT
jgi:glycosyltransferase involved in cell wall biosynthesis